MLNCTKQCSFTVRKNEEMQLSKRKKIPLISFPTYHPGKASVYDLWNLFLCILFDRKWVITYSETHIFLNLFIFKFNFIFVCVGSSSFLSVGFL